MQNSEGAVEKVWESDDCIHFVIVVNKWEVSARP